MRYLLKMGCIYSFLRYTSFLLKIDEVELLNPRDADGRCKWVDLIYLGLPPV